jgi:predicted RNA-binding Zn ribbon-like protein
MNASKPPYKFLADAIGLDFLNALVHPADKDGTITDGESFVRWIEEAGLVPADALAALRVKAVSGEIDVVAAQARALGEWFRGFVQDYKGNSLPATAIDRLQPLNRILERDRRAGKVDVRDTFKDRIGGSGLKLTSERAYGSPDMLLLPIAQAMAEFVCVEEFGNVRRCEGTGCDLLFLDRTRGQARRWCSMALCGNRAKQATHRSTRDQSSRPASCPENPDE